jgi:small subunit ribosomal protein S8
MPVTDPIADMLTSMRNAALARHRRVDIPASRTKQAILEVLRKEKYIQNFRLIPDEKQGVLRVYLKYNAEQEPVIRTLRRVSTPGRRTYVGRDEIPRVLGGFGTSIISTSQGILTGKEALKRGLGGEVMVEVW